VVNQRVNLPRQQRRWLRAVEHRTASHNKSRRPASGSGSHKPVKRPTLTPRQLAGWQALVTMIQQQGSDEN
jgi:hypothetical protein